MLPFIAAAGAALKALLAWLIRFILKWLLIQVVLAITVYFASNLINDLVEALKKEIEALNNFILAEVFVVENFLFELQHNIYNKVNDLWNTLQTKIESTLNAILPEQLNAVLAIINFAAWLDVLATDVTQLVKETVYNIINDAVTPLANEIASQINTIVEIENIINSAVRNVYDNIAGAVQDQVTLFNIKIVSLFNEINSMLDWFNASILEIQQAVEQSNVELTTNHAVIQAWIDQNLQPGSITEADIIELKAKLQLYKPVNIDFSKYVYTATPAAENYVLEISLPDYNFEVSVFIPQLQDVKTRLSNQETRLRQLPEDVATKFVSIFPDMFQANFESRLRQFIIIAITTALLSKKNQITEYFTDISNSILEDMEAGKQAIISKSKEIIQAVEEKELQLIAKIPAVVKPALQKAIERIEKNVAEKQEEILVNVDRYVPNTTEVDHLIERFPKYIKANPNPNKFDTREWTLVDIYRILCNYFSRTERIALVIHLSSQDMQLDQAELANLFPPVD